MADIGELLARLTAGTSWKTERGPGGSISAVNSIMGALGMGKAGRPGALILMANYMECEDAKRWALGWVVRWAWLTWLKVGQNDAMVSLDQMKSLCAVALAQHIDPEAGRRTGVKATAELIGVNHQTFRKKYRKHFQRVQAEIAYQESQAKSALEAHLN